MRTAAGWERPAITVLTMLIVALILWVGNSVQQTRVEMAAIQVELSYIKQGIINESNSFMEIEGRHDQLFNSIESRLDSIEKALSIHMQQDKEANLD